MINNLATNAGMIMKKEKILSKYRTSAVTYNAFYNLHLNGTDVVNTFEDDAASALSIFPPYHRLLIIMT